MEILLCVEAADPPETGVTTCDDCEFCITNPSLDGRGDYQYCEKGYWKEET